MKIICINDVEGDEVTFYLRPDTALLRNNNPFYYPDFTKQLTARVCVVFRVCRLGRSISENFAKRYYDALGVGVTFTAADVWARCVAQKKPWDRAVAFDYSAALSREFVPLEEWNDNIHVTIEGSLDAIPQLTLDNLRRMPQIISQLSNLMIFKMGDYIFLPVSPDFEVQRGNRIETYFGDRKMLAVTIS